MYNNYEDQTQEFETTNGDSDEYYSNTDPSAARDTQEELTKKKKAKNGFAAKVIAICLSCALIGGIAGSSTAVYFFSQKNSPVASVAASGNSLGTATSINSGSAMSINSIYETYKNAVVGVSIEGATTDAYGQASTISASGTGFIISPDGYIITNHHVVENANKVTVTLFDGNTYTATIVGSDQQNDIALLKIDATNLSTVKLGDSDNLVVGEEIIAIGNPLGELTYTVTAGIVSAENREINESINPVSMFQTDLAINPGNSGGPVFNLKGEVVGISTAKYSASSVEGLGFAIPINDAVSVANQLKTNGYVTGRPSLGISVMDIASSPSANNGPTSGVYVAEIDPSSGSAKAGIQIGDVITSLGDTTITSTTDLASAKKNFKAGDTTTITIYREGEEMILTITFDEAKSKI